jgi:hypothetical protein
MIPRCQTRFKDFISAEIPMLERQAFTHKKLTSTEWGIDKDRMGHNFKLPDRSPDGPRPQALGTASAHRQDCMPGGSE